MPWEEAFLFFWPVVEAQVLQKSETTKKTPQNHNLKGTFSSFDLITKKLKWRL